MINKQNVVQNLVKNIGLLDDVKIKNALEKQIATKGRLSSLLVKLGYTSNEKVGHTLIAQLGISPLVISPQNIEKKAINFIGSHIASLHRIIPLRQEGAKLILGTDDPLNFLAQQNLEEFIGMKIELELVESCNLDKLLNELYLPNKDLVVDIVKSVKAVENVKTNEDAPIIKLVNMIINEAVQKRASDIHIEPLENKFRVRYRIDGMLHEVSGPPKRLQGSFIGRLKIMAGMNMAEKRLPQDGRIKLSLDKKELDLRVSSLPAMYGESIVMRLLDKSNFLVGIEDLGLLTRDRKEVERLINLPNGILLVTGPTGSGKTTTLYAVLSHINQKERKVITIEDPVEYQLDGINQVQVKPQIGLTFANGLRSMLRQAPDIIMVGEIRDLETAQISIQSALTGHLIFSTLHTNDASSSITRLVDMGIKPYLVASTAQGILAQRLIRTLCPSCRKPYKPSSEEKAMMMLNPHEEKEIDLYSNKGCPLCNNTGFKGRMGIYELLVVTDKIKEMILDNAPSSEICKKAKEFGMKTLREDGLEKVQRGYTTIQEVLRVTHDV